MTQVVRQNAPGAGRPRTFLARGTGFELSELLDEKLGDKTNLQVASKLNVRSANVVSMWRNGRTKIALERLAELSDLINVDLSITLPMWFQQMIGDQFTASEKATKLKPILDLIKRCVTKNEMAVVTAIRTAVGKGDPDFTTEQVKAIAKIAADPALAEKLMAD